VFGSENINMTLSIGGYDVNKLIEYYNMSYSQITDFENQLGNKLEVFYNDYNNNHYNKLEDLRKELVASYFDKTSSLGVNSIKSRTKDAYHVIEKIIRKKYQSNKYNEINLDNYIYYLDDLIGIRLILLYNDDWYKIHDFIIDNFELNSDKYIPKDKRKTLPFDDYFIIEPPVINLRKGDDETIYSKWLKENSPFIVNRGRYYRSIHYSICYKGYCFELQVRSVFDEAWAEIDHNLLYPSNLNVKACLDYSKMLNRLAGAANEMSSFFVNNVFPKFQERHAYNFEIVPNELDGILVSYDEASKNNAPLKSVDDINQNVIKNGI